MEKDFFKNGHLTVEGLTLYAEAIRLDAVVKLPEGFYQHLLTCDDCDDEVMTLAEFILHEPYDAATHPYLGEQAASDYMITDNPEDLDRILEQLIAEATPVVRYERMIAQTFAFRSSTATHFKVLAPEKDQLCVGEVVFRFENNTNKPIQLVVENQDRQRVADAMIDADTNEYRIDCADTNQFSSGLYYWKAAVKGTKPLMGKFYVYASF